MAATGVLRERARVVTGRPQPAALQTA